MRENFNKAASTTEREIIATCVFDAPRELVWQVWTDPKHIIHWWGPNGFTNTIREMEVSPGGVWRFIMHGPDGIDYRNEIIYIDVKKPERLVYYHVSGPKFHVTVTFDDEGGKTKLSMRMLFDTAAELEQAVRKFNAVEGLGQTLGRLKDYLGKSR
jgi:uncharacterized protein YndB with AHSA1/START domain